MDDVLFAISMASLELGLLQTKLQDRAMSPDISTDMRNEIALQLPEIATKKRDLDRLVIARRQATFPDPTPAVMDNLTKATQEISKAIAADARVGVLLGLAGSLVGAAKALGG